MRPTTLLLIILACGSAHAATDWSGFRGPVGNGTADADAADPIADPGKARLVWQSAEEVPPSGRNYHGKYTTGFSSPAVADGRVFLFWYLGDGKVIDRGFFDAISSSGINAKLPEDRRKAIASIGADEVYLCLDAKTGKTLWKKTIAGNGVNIQGSGSGKCGGHFSLAAGEGRLFAIGTNAHAYCFDAANGDLLWEAPTGPTPQRVAALQEAIARQTLKGVDFGRVGSGRSELPNCAPAYADGVVWVYDRAFDAKTGKVLWEGHHGNSTPSPVVWEVEGKKYFISGGGVCIEPRTGKVLWKAEGDNGGGATPAIGEGYLVLGGAKACYRITPEKCERVWTIDHKGGSADMSSSAVIHRGHLWANTSHPAGHRRESAKYGSCANLVCIELATGKEICRIGGPSNSGSLIAFGPWVIQEGVGAGAKINGIGFYNADPAHDPFATVASLEYPGPFQDSVTPAIAGSRMYLRGAQHVYCYELGR